MKKTILITGGAGFIGSHLAESLIQEFNILIVDNLSTGFIINLNGIINQITFIEEDVELVDLYNLGKIDVIVHLAAQTSVPLSIDKFKKSSIQNLSSSLNIIDFCSNNNVPMVYASSSAVYGNLPIGDDKSSIVDLISPYAVDKYAMEKYLEMSNKLYGLSSIGLRFFNVFGPRQDPNNPYSGVISIFIKNLIIGKKLQINGGHQTRDFVYVLDVVEAIKKSINLVINKPVLDVVNVLSGNSCSIDELVEVLIRITKTNPKIYRTMLPKGDPEKSFGTLEKMSSILGIRTNEMTDLELGLKTIIKDMS